MKKVKTLLSIAILILLHNSAWSMEEEIAITKTQTKVVIPKGKYHDGTKSWFGSGENTLDHLGENFYGQEYGPGSDDETESRWDKVGRGIKTVDRAVKFLKLVDERGWNLSKEALEPSERLVVTEKQKSQSQIETYSSELCQQEIGTLREISSDSDLSESSLTELNTELLKA